MIIVPLDSFLKSPSLYFLSFSGWFQSLGHEAPAAQSEETTQPQEAPTVDPGQQRLMEEQQRRQEAVVQKDRVSFAMVVCVTFGIVLVMNYSCSYKFIIHHEMSSVPLDISPVYAEKLLFQKVRTSLIMLLKTSFRTLQQMGTFLHPDILKTVLNESSLCFFGKVCVRGEVF